MDHPSLLSSSGDMSHDERFSQLFSYELEWIGRQSFLQSRGYMLRPRFRPGWVPSWRTTGARPLDCEDSYHLGLPHVIDATRISDGKLVNIKRVYSGNPEKQIALMLRRPPLDRDPTNHCVPILDTFDDNEDASASYMVMPFLRDFDNPPFECVEDLLEFGEQMLEGLAFLHQNGVAHRDCSAPNIMMDADPLYPQGFHPIHSNSLPDSHGLAWPRSRSHFPVKYYFIDFGISAYIPPDAYPKLAIGVYGRDQEPPELSLTVPYNPFKLDIFIMGNMFRKDFYDVFKNVDFLHPIIGAMTRSNPIERPSATDALQQWQRMRRQVPYIQRHWRMRQRDEPFIFGLCSDNVYLATLAAHWITGSQYTNNLFQY